MHKNPGREHDAKRQEYFLNLTDLIHRGRLNMLSDLCCLEAFPLEHARQRLPLLDGLEKNLDHGSQFDYMSD